MNSKTKITPVGNIPKDWDLLKIKDIGVVQTGNTPSKKEKKFWGGKYYWATAQDFGSKYVCKTTETLTDIGIQKARLLPKGTILITCIACWRL